MTTPFAFTADPLGAPLLVAFDVGVSVHLTPVTRAQLRAAEAEDEGAFADLLSASETFAPELPGGLADEAREGALALGALPEEAERYAALLTRIGGETHRDEAYAVPTLGQWKALHRELLARFPPGAPALLAASSARPDCTEPILAFWQHATPLTWADALLLTGGLVEWVREGAHFAGMGAPRAAFYPNLYRPPHTVVRPIRPGERMRAFGFRCAHTL